MKKCFTFSSYTECKKLAKHLEAKLSANVFIQLGNTLTVSRDMYEAAITEGKKYVKEQQIPCNWLDGSDHLTPVDLVPFSYISVEKKDSVSPYFLSSSILSSVKTFTQFCETILNRQVFTQVHLNGDIVFLIEAPISVEEHLAITNNLINHSYSLRCKAGTTFSFTDSFGNNIYNE